MTILQLASPTQYRYPCWFLLPYSHVADGVKDAVKTDLGLASGEAGRYASELFNFMKYSFNVRLPYSGASISIAMTVMKNSTGP